jgi:hypothetical protein
MAHTQDGTQYAAQCVPMFTTPMPADLTPIHDDALVKAGLNPLWFDAVSYIPLQEGLRSNKSRLQGK